MWRRIGPWFCGAVAFAIYLVVATVPVALTSAGGRFGWAVATLVFVAPVVGIAAHRLWRKGTAHRAVVAPILATLLVSLTWGRLVSRELPPDNARLFDALDQIGVPSHARLDEESAGGEWCLDDCWVDVDRYYCVGSEVTMGQLQLRLERAGYRPEFDGDDVRVGDPAAVGSLLYRRDQVSVMFVLSDATESETPCVGAQLETYARGLYRSMA